MDNGSGVYVLYSGTGTASPCDCKFYASHGTFQGVDGVIGQSNLEGAKLFSSKEEAEVFIEKLPTWARPRFSPREVSEYALLVHAPKKYGGILRRQRKLLEAAG